MGLGYSAGLPLTWSLLPGGRAGGRRAAQHICEQRALLRSHLPEGVHNEKLFFIFYQLARIGAARTHEGRNRAAEELRHGEELAELRLGGAGLPLRNRALG